MKKLLVILLLCCSTPAYGQTTVTETTHQMSDDSAIKVTLPFTFTYYNQQFTDTWMYDNGIISFLQPGTPNAIQPWQWNSQPLNQVTGNYFIAPLWVDLAPVGPTKYITQTDGTYMKYIWQDIAEYYSAWGNWRLNTFNTTIKNDGTIETQYTKIDLQTSSISVGTVGNISAGEYNQIYYSPCCVATTTGMIPDWTKAGPPPPPPPPPVTPPTEVYVPPVVVEETTTQPTTTAVVSIEAEPTVATVALTNTIVTTILVQAATESSPASVATASIAATTSSASSDGASNKMSISDAQSIARTNQKNVTQLVNSVVSNSIEQSISITTTEIDTNSSNDIAISSTNNTQSSYTGSNVVSGSSTNSVDVGQNNIPTAASITGLANFARLPGATIEETSETNEQRILTLAENNETFAADNNANSVNTEINNIVADETNPTSVRSLAANNVPAKLLEEEDKKNIEISDMNNNSSVSELAVSGLQLTELQVLPIGYNIYLTTVLKDSPFYLPKAIYRNQTVVDNAPVQRRLQFASDAKFDKMVSQQYGEQ